MKRVAIAIWFCCLSFARAGSVPEAEGSILYVDGSNLAAGALSGSSWDDAFRDLQSALAVATAGDQIWVAAGVYVPGIFRTSTFQLKTGVSLFGGFPLGGGALDERDIAGNVTVLSGNIGSGSSNSDNCYHVITGTGVGEQTCIDGFTVSGGNANASPPDDKGGGLFCNESGTPTSSDCVFEDNFAADQGGAIFISRVAARLIANDCLFMNNEATSAGGAVTVSTAVGEFNRCRFNSNRAEFAGALFNSFSESVYTNCSFEGNEADYGGAVYNLNGRSLRNPTFAQCLFVSNRASWGGAMYGWSTSPILRNCTIHGNQAIRGGGALYVTEGWGPYLHNSIIWNNMALGVTDTVSALVVLSGDSEFFSHNSLVDNSGGSIAWDRALYEDRGGNIDIDPLFVQEVDPALAPMVGGTDLRLRPGSPAIGTARNDHIVPGLDQDFRGAPRIVGETVDIGAFEYVPEMVAQTVGYEYHPELVLKIEISSLLAQVTGGIVEPLSLLSFSEPVRDESSLQISGKYLIYRPTPGQAWDDAFISEVSDGFSSANLTVLLCPKRVGAEGSNIVRVTVDGDSVAILAAGIPGRRYRLEGSGDMNQWMWLSDSVPCPSAGLMNFSPPGPFPDPMFFRVRHIGRELGE